ncbi:hypothetical protein MNEG_1573, partial [Monoraphidium neglectum]
VRSSLLPGLATALVDCVRQRRHAPGDVAASAVLLIPHLLQPDIHEQVSHLLAQDPAAADPLLALVAGGDPHGAVPALALLTTIAYSSAQAARCAACPAALETAAQYVLSSGVEPLSAGGIAIRFMSVVAIGDALNGSCAKALVAQPRVIKAAVRAVTSDAAERDTAYEAARLLAALSTAGDHDKTQGDDVTRELLRAPGALAALVRRLSPPTELRTRWCSALSISIAVARDKEAARLALQLAVMRPLFALLETFEAGQLAGEGVPDGSRSAGGGLHPDWVVVLIGLLALAKAADDGGASFARAAEPVLSGVVCTLIDAASRSESPNCESAMSLLRILGSNFPAREMCTSVGHKPHVVAAAAQVLCGLLRGRQPHEPIQLLTLCGSLHTLGNLVIPEPGAADITLLSVPWVPELTAALRAVVAGPLTAAESGNQDQAQLQANEARGSAGHQASREVRQTATDILQRLQAALGVAAQQQQEPLQTQQQQHQQQEQQEQEQQEQEQQEQQQQRQRQQAAGWHEPQEQRQQQPPSTQPQAGAPAASPAAGAAAAASERCAECGTGGRLRLCRGCRAVRYCGEECARRAWKGGHRAECLAAQAAGQAAGQQPS